MIVAEDQEQVDKILALRDQLPALRLVIYDDPRGHDPVPHDWLKSFEELQERGREFAAEHPGYFEAEIEKGRAGRRRDHLLHLGHDRQSEGRDAHPRQRGRRRRDSFGRRVDAARRATTSLAYLPMAWVGRLRSTRWSLSLVVGFCCNCPESPETVQRDLRELGPDHRAGPAAHLGEHAHRGAGAGRRRHSAQAARLRVLPRAPRSGPRSCGRTASRCPLGLAAAHRARRVLRVRARPRPARAAAAPVGAHRRRAARARTPSASSARSASTSSRSTAPPRRPGSCRCSRTREANPTTAGRPCPGVEVRIADRGEVLVQGRGDLQGLLQERGGHPRGHRRRRLVPHRRRRLHRSAGASGHHRPRQGRGRARRRHALRARSSSRTSSSSARTSGRRWPSATRSRSWPP